MTYDGYVEAGVDFTKVRVSLDEDGTINLIMPEVELRGPVIDPDSIEIKDEKHSIFTDFSEAERAVAMQDLKSDILNKADEKGIKEKARENADQMIRNFVKGIVGDGYELHIE